VLSFRGRDKSGLVLQVWAGYVDRVADAEKPPIR